MNRTCRHLSEAVQRLDLRVYAEPAATPPRGPGGGPPYLRAPPFSMPERSAAAAATLPAGSDRVEPIANGRPRTPRFQGGRRGHLTGPASLGL